MSLEATCSLGREWGQQGTLRDLAGTEDHRAGPWDRPRPPPCSDTGSDAEGDWGAKDQRWSVTNPLETAWTKPSPAPLLVGARVPGGRFWEEKLLR